MFSILKILELLLVLRSYVKEEKTKSKEKEKRRRKKKKKVTEIRFLQKASQITP